MWPIVQVWYTLKLKLSCHDWSHYVQSMTKTRKDNDVTDHIGAIYAKNEIELSWLIGQGVTYDEEDANNDVIVHVRATSEMK